MTRIEEKYEMSPLTLFQSWFSK